MKYLLILIIFSISAFAAVKAGKLDSHSLYLWELSISEITDGTLPPLKQRNVEGEALNEFKIREPEYNTKCHLTFYKEGVSGGSSYFESGHLECDINGTKIKINPATCGYVTVGTNKKLTTENNELGSFRSNSSLTIFHPSNKSKHLWIYFSCKNRESKK